MGGTRGLAVKGCEILEIALAERLAPGRTICPMAASASCHCAVIWVSARAAFSGWQLSARPGVGISTAARAMDGRVRIMTGGPLSATDRTMIHLAASH